MISILLKLPETQLKAFRFLVVLSSKLSCQQRDQHFCRTVLLEPCALTPWLACSRIRVPKQSWLTALSLFLLRTKRQDPQISLEKKAKLSSEANILDFWTFRPPTREAKFP
jgi:hypothetical protein